MLFDDKQRSKKERDQERKKEFYLPDLFMFMLHKPQLLPFSLNMIKIMFLKNIKKEKQKTKNKNSNHTPLNMLHQTPQNF